MTSSSTKEAQNPKESGDNDDVSSGPLDSREPHLVFDNFDIDIVIKVLDATIFSPFFVIFLPITLLSQTHSGHPAFILSCIWTGIICFIGTLNHIDRKYRSGGTWLFAPEKLKWDEQIVLITGGGSGIGALLAETLAMRNVSVVVLTKDPPKFENDNENIYTYICDVSDYKSVEAVAEKVREEVGDPTIIVNNAGVVKGKLLLDLTEDDVKDTFGSNTLAHFWILKAFLPSLLRQNHGHIITVSSVMGVVGAAQMTDYCASKAALISLNQSLRFELDNRYKTPNIRTTLLLPSFISTTSLFSKTVLPSSRLFNFFCPPLQSHQIVKVIIDNLDSRESKIIRLPFYTNLARVINDSVGVVPSWMRDLIQRIAGADYAMKEYGSKPDAAERLAVDRQSKSKQE
ncbi:hypothetical protein L486_04327 [Kwoniella mangroviensis CBS 10435]|uniref:Short-chain dehydrogenase/reductase 3 n=1 Tax=Kwoniella mangroviensis CBS 10435 TaxID=1331196 RepID=A0A1B9IRX6_9TREE|nr:uncharacterized protein I203_02581 [Kwoniella mangroviensis CBS 8507]OCF58296.1 hypothetical protein L486_04327 [Kwoniella mangroviensis CBS 10435]OCF67923.1 hypothetical protein I203_02581 [Kwoniella mangroviensis CBS 8507]